MHKCTSCLCTASRNGRSIQGGRSCARNAHCPATRLATTHTQPAMHTCKVPLLLAMAWQSECSRRHSRRPPRPQGSPTLRIECAPPACMRTHQPLLRASSVAFEARISQNVADRFGHAFREERGTRQVTHRFGRRGIRATLFGTECLQAGWA